MADATSRTAQQLYDDVVTTTFAPVLRAVGFTGSRGRFELPSEAYWVQLGFQKSAFSDSTALKFTVNLSVIRREVWDEHVSAKPYLGSRPKPSTFYGSWAKQVRIGLLMPAAEDRWWWLKRGDDPDGVGHEVTAALRELALPWLHRESGTER